jgi:hypothetical protein
MSGLDHIDVAEVESPEITASLALAEHLRMRAWLTPAGASIQAHAVVVQHEGLAPGAQVTKVAGTR